MSSVPVLDVPPESFDLFITAVSATARLTVTGKVVRGEDDGWMFALDDGTPDGKICLFAPEQRSRLARWLAERLERIATERPRRR